MAIALFLSGFFIQRARVDQVAVGAVHPAVGGAVDPDDPVAALHAQSRMGRGQPADLQAHRRGRAELAQRSDARAVDGDPRAHLEVAAVLDADPDRRAACDRGRALRGRPRSTAPRSWQKFRYVTWPSMQTLYLTCTILSMIFTLGDFNSVYLLTGGGPADLTHVLATLGIRYLRLDQVDMSMAAIVVRAAAGAAAGLLHDEAAVEMNAPDAARSVGTEAKLLLIGIPVLHVDDAPDLPPVPVRDLAEGDAPSPGKLWPDHPTLRNFEHRASARSTISSRISGGSCGTRCSSRSRPACSRC